MATDLPLAVSCPGVGGPAAAKAAAKAAKFGELSWGAPQSPASPGVALTSAGYAGMGTQAWHIIPHEHGDHTCCLTPPPQVLGLEGCRVWCPV